MSTITTPGLGCEKTHKIRIPCNLRSILGCHSQLVRNCFPMRIQADSSHSLALFPRCFFFATAAFYQFTQCCNIIDFVMSILWAKLNLCIFIVTGSANIKCPISFTCLFSISTWIGKVQCYLNFIRRFFVPVFERFPIELRLIWKYEP